MYIPIYQASTYEVSPNSSAVERSTVNRLVIGSNPIWGGSRSALDMPWRGFEPPRFYAQDFESYVSTISPPRHTILV